MVVRALVMLALAAAARAQALRGALPLNGSVSGTTAGGAGPRPAALANPAVGGGGKALYRLDVPAGAYRLRVTTCDAATRLDTYLAVYAGAPAVGVLAERPLWESGGDSECDLPGAAAVGGVLGEGVYSVLVAGEGLSEGEFVVHVQGGVDVGVGVPWGLDRVDQRAPPLDGRYGVVGGGAGVVVYVVDSGVRASHVEFGGRVQDGFDFVAHTKAAGDCYGRGTHAAGVIAGGTAGMAGGADIVAVRVVDCDGGARVSHVVDALEWALADAQNRGAPAQPVVLYLGVGQAGDGVEERVRALQTLGVLVVRAAGDDGEGVECLGGVMVGGVGREARRSAFSAYGECVRLFAPAEGVRAAGGGGDTGFEVRSGTAVAAAHVAGGAAMLLALNNDLAPAQVAAALVAMGTPDVVANATGAAEAQAEGGEGEARLLFVRQVPPRWDGDGVPGPGRMFVYFVVRFAGGCDAGGAAAFADALEVAANAVRGECVGDDTRFRVEERERSVAAVAVRLDAALRADKPALEDAAGATFDVAEYAWFVDAAGHVFWAEAQFGERGGGGPGVAQIAGIAVGVLAALVAVCFAVWAVVRRSSGVDDIESMVGSADYEKEPIEFHDDPARRAEGDDGKSIGRSFRNMFDGLGKQLSMRSGRSSSRRAGFGGEDGISRMDSYVGEIRGVEGGGGTDMVRMHSYGGEAFVGLGNIARNASTRSIGSSSGGDTPSRRGSLRALFGLGKDQREASFRGKEGIMVTDGATGGAERGDASDEDEQDSSGAVRMHSMGGEAFALVLGQDGIGGGGARESTKPAPKTDGDAGRAHARYSHGADILAPPTDDESSREPSFFGGV